MRKIEGKRTIMRMDQDNLEDETAELVNPDLPWTEGDFIESEAEREDKNVMII